MILSIGQIIIFHCTAEVGTKTPDIAKVQREKSKVYQRTFAKHRGQKSLAFALLCAHRGFNEILYENASVIKGSGQPRGRRFPCIAGTGEWKLLWAVPFGLLKSPAIRARAEFVK